MTTMMSISLDFGDGVESVEMGRAACSHARRDSIDSLSWARTVIDCYLIKAEKRPRSVGRT